jgi:aryl-alcohol dehydrogenase-like predicted oxidoreductase
VKDEIYNCLPMWNPENYEKMTDMLVNVQNYAKNINLKTSQLVLAWINAKGLLPLPGSSSFENNKSNFLAYKVVLSDQQTAELDQMTFDMTEKWNIKRYS